VVTNNGNLLKVSVSCGTGKIAIGGGASSGSQTVTSTYPSNNGTATTNGSQATGWTATFGGTTGSNTVYAICVAG